jgi:hypothetical protein
MVRTAIETRGRGGRGEAPISRGETQRRRAQPLHRARCARIATMFTLGAAGPPPQRFKGDAVARGPRRGRGRVLELEPIARAARDVARAQPLRDNALQPILQACRKTTSPACRKCSFSRSPAPLPRSTLASVALRVSIGSRRRSTPSSSKRERQRADRATDDTIPTFPQVAFTRRRQPPPRPARF